jgi:hypothetical protein
MSALLRALIRLLFRTRPVKVDAIARKAGSAGLPAPTTTGTTSL